MPKILLLLFLRILLLLFSSTACQGKALTAFVNTRPPCGNWTPYEDDKCYKIVDKAGTQSQSDAEMICQTFTEGEEEDLHYRVSSGKLVTIKSEEEQKFLQYFLFVENELPDNVWLGLRERNHSGMFEWNDGTKLKYVNWLNQTVTDDRHQCVEMESGSGVHAVGFWSKVDCKKRNVVVCERPQVWTLETLQKIVFKMREEQERLKKEWDENMSELKREILEIKNMLPEKDNNNNNDTALLQQMIEDLQQKSNATEQKVDSLKERCEATEDELLSLRNETEERVVSLKQSHEKIELETSSLKQIYEALKHDVEKLKQNCVGGEDSTDVPSGFIYIQLPGQDPPTTIWPTLNWTEVSSSYAGLFFRVVGDRAAPFGHVQEGNSSHLEEIEWSTNGPGFSPVTVPSDGRWSNYVWTAGGTGTHRYLRFRLSSTETRPRNQAIRVWKRVD